MEFHLKMFFYRGSCGIIYPMSTMENVLKENASLKALVADLQEQLSWFKKQVFGAKSEKLVDDESDQLKFPGMEILKPEEQERVEIKGHIRKKRAQEKSKIEFPDDLPKKQIFLDLPEDQKVCPLTGEPLKKIGEEISQKLAYNPGAYFIKEYIRPKYASPSRPEIGVMVKEMPGSIFSKGRVDESLLSHIITMKFADHLPLYRIQEILERDQVKISRQLLSHWVLTIGENLIPLYDLMEKRILENNSIFVDETPINVLVKGKKKAHEGYMWVYKGGGGLDPPYTLYDFRMNRNHSNAIDKLKNYKGLLHSDQYGAYETLSKIESIIWQPCMAHVRRYFIEAQTGDQEFKKWVLRQIRYLYMFERVTKTRSSEERLRIRQEKEKPILENLIKEVKSKLIEGKSLPKSKYTKALKYFAGVADHIGNYLNHPEAHIDNNVAERAIRPLTIGRKNWLFVGSEKGGKAAATLLSLIQTCRHLKINPREYMEDIMRRIMDHPFNKLDELLPDKWAEEHQKIQAAA
jgi:transposase